MSLIYGRSTVVETREIAHELMFKGSKPTAIGTLKEKILEKNDHFTSLFTAVAQW